MNIGNLIKSIVKRKLESGISFTIDLPTFCRNEEVARQRKEKRNGYQRRGSESTSTSK